MGEKYILENRQKTLNVVTKPALRGGVEEWRPQTGKVRTNYFKSLKIRTGIYKTVQLI